MKLLRTTRNHLRYNEEYVLCVVQIFDRHFSIRRHYTEDSISMINSIEYARIVEASILEDVFRKNSHKHTQR